MRKSTKIALIVAIIVFIASAIYQPIYKIYLYPYAARAYDALPIQIYFTATILLYGSIGFILALLISHYARLRLNTPLRLLSLLSSVFLACVVAYTLCLAIPPLRPLVENLSAYTWRPLYFLNENGFIYTILGAFAALPIAAPLKNKESL